MWLCGYDLPAIHHTEHMGKMYACVPAGIGQWTRDTAQFGMFPVSWIHRIFFNSGRIWSKSTELGADLYRLHSVPQQYLATTHGLGVVDDRTKSNTICLDVLFHCPQDHHKFYWMPEHIQGLTKPQIWKPRNVE